MRWLAAMGILSFLFGGAGANGQGAQFVTAQAFQDNLTRQTTMSPQTLAELRKHGVANTSRLKLEFFFYTNLLAKAERLANALKEKGYGVEYGTSASDKSVLVVTGWTTPLLMDDETVVSWTEQMTRLGYEHDCEFDGWGTDPSQ